MKLFATVLFSGFTAFLSAQVSYMYSDRNMNTYTVKETELKYDGVKAKESSSGDYSGGEHKTKIITPYDLNKINVLFDEAVTDTLSHQKQRSMGSGLFIRYNKTTVEKKMIIKYDSPTQQKIETLLQSLIQ
jgi:hypothetical protein